MATTQLSKAIQDLRRAALSRDGGGLTDGQLLESFVTHRDEAAFEALVHLHGPMVLGVCRRLLGNVHDSEEAFQATFLVLARKAASVRPREMVGNWLYGVAYRTALAARTLNARRRGRERQVKTMPEPQTAPQEPWLELQPLLDQELSGLPDKYRVPVVLCELEGRTRKDVARQLGIPEGTLSSRLATARKLLAGRLARRGLALSGGGLGILLSENVAAAAVPASLVASTVKAATLVAAGEAATTALVSARVANLAKGVMEGMFVSKLKIATAVLLTLGLLGTGVGVVTHQVLAGDEARSDKVAKPEGALRDNQKPAEGERPRDGDKPREGDRPRDGEKPREGEKPRDGEKPREGDKGAGRGGEEVTVTGTVSRQETKRTRDDGSEVSLTSYYLTEEKGNRVLLPGPRVTESGKLLDKFNLADLVGKEVTLTGRAFTAKVGEGSDAPKRVVRIINIIDIKEKK